MRQTYQDQYKNWEMLNPLHEKKTYLFRLFCLVLAEKKHPSSLSGNLDTSVSFSKSRRRRQKKHIQKQTEQEYLDEATSHFVKRFETHIGVRTSQSCKNFSLFFSSVTGISNYTVGEALYSNTNFKTHTHVYLSLYWLCTTL